MFHSNIWWISAKLETMYEIISKLHDIIISWSISELSWNIWYNNMLKWSPNNPEIYDITICWNDLQITLKYTNTKIRNFNYDRYLQIDKFSGKAARIEGSINTLEEKRIKLMQPFLIEGVQSFTLFLGQTSQHISIIPKSRSLKNCIKNVQKVVFPPGHYWFF